MRSGRRLRLNVVDGIIVVIIVLAVLFGVRHFAPKGSGQQASKASPAVVLFTSSSTPNWKTLMPRLKIGDPVRAVLGGTPYSFGTVRSVLVVPTRMSEPDSTGQIHIVTDPATRRLRMEINVQASGGKTGAYTVGGNPLFIGESLNIQAGPIWLPGSVSNITAP